MSEPEGRNEGDGEAGGAPEASGKHSVSARFDCADEAARTEGLAAAALALRTGLLVVLPTDTVYGVGADAFHPAGVISLLAAKGPGPDTPPPRLVATLPPAPPPIH